MLQRAASNTYSWWWASHIRTKQSKWLEQCLRDMEERVGRILKLIDDDGDSFAKRAEMYYKRRPELISSVEESFKSFRSLADRYDLLSKDLQNANHTIATVFPEQVQFGMGEDDDFPFSKDHKNPPLPPDAKPHSFPPVPPPDPPPPNAGWKPIAICPATAPKPFKSKKSSNSENEPKLSLTKEAALDEIKNLQKEILELQTVKEIRKSSYENGVAKYWEVENQIIDMQQRVLELQDEFNVGAVIEDNEARTLMAEAALKSCEETLTMLQEKQDKLISEAREEYTRIEATCDRVKSLRDKYIPDDDRQVVRGKKKDDGGHRSEKDMARLIQEPKEVEEQKLAPESKSSTKEVADSGTVTVSTLTVSQMVEKIDRLVTKVISLETAVSTQNALVDTFKRETDDLHAHIRKLEDEKGSLIDDNHGLLAKVKEMEERLSKLQELNRDVESQHSNMQMDFAEARSSLDRLSEKLGSVMPDEAQEETSGASHDEPAVVYSRDEVGEKLEEIHSEQEETSGSARDEPAVFFWGDTVEEKLGEIHTEQDKTNVASHDKLAVSCSGDKVKDKLREIHADLNPDKVEATAKENKDSPQADDYGKSSVTPSETKGAGDIKGVNLLNADRSQASESELKLDREREPNPVPREINRAAIPTDKLDNGVEADARKCAERNKEMSWQQMLLSGVEDREAILLKEYTAILRNYKDLKRKLHDMEKKEKDSEFGETLRIRELRRAILKRDHEIRCLRQRLQDSQIADVKGDLLSILDTDEDASIDNEEKEIQSIESKKIPSLTKAEGKLQADIDAILEDNLDFWLRFSTAYHQVRKLKTEVEDLQAEAWRLKERRRPDGSSSSHLKSDVKAIKNHLREIQTELSVWVNQSFSLKDELESRSTSLCSIQEEITEALGDGADEEEIQFSSLQAAKLQGEILSMKQETNKVREEQQACLDHVKVLQLEIDKTIRQLNEDFSIGSEQPENSFRARIPLRAFLFGSKLKKKALASSSSFSSSLSSSSSPLSSSSSSIFSRMHPSKKNQLITSDADAHIAGQRDS